MLDFLIIFLTVLYKYVLMNAKDFIIICYGILAVICILCLIKIVGGITLRQIPPLGQWPAGTLLVIGYALVMTVLSRDANFLLPLVLGVAFSRTNYRVVVYNFLYASLICFVTQLVMFVSGITTSRDMVRYSSTGEINIRSSLGFESVNIVFCYFLPIFLCAYLLTRHTRYRPLFYLSSILCVMLLYSATGSRTSLVLMALFVVMTLFWGNCETSKGYIARYVAPLLFFVMTVSSYVVAQVYGSRVDTEINLLFTGRPYIWNSYLSISAPLFGNGVQATLPNAMILPQYGASLDNYYIFFLHCYGLIPLIIMGFLYGVLLYKLGAARRVDMVLAVLAYLIFGFVETNTIIASTNFMLIFIFAIWFNPQYFSSPPGEVALRARRPEAMPHKSRPRPAGRRQAGKLEERVTK